MKWPRKRQHVTSLEKARAARRESESRLRHVMVHLVGPLREMREQNHITDAVRVAIAKKVEESGR